MDKIKRKIYLDKIIEVMKNDFPLFNNIELYGFYEQLSEEELIYVFSSIFGKLVRIVGLGILPMITIYDERGNKIYYETSDGKWWKKEYDKNGNRIYYEDSYGKWGKREYDKNGNKIYFENSNGLWIKYEYDEYGKLTYEEDSDGKKTLYNRL